MVEDQLALLRISRGLCVLYLKQSGSAAICTLNFHEAEIRVVQDANGVFSRGELGPSRVECEWNVRLQLTDDLALSTDCAHTEETPINPNKQSTLCFIYSSFCGSATKDHLAAIPIGGHPWQSNARTKPPRGISHAISVERHARGASSNVAWQPRRLHFDTRGCAGGFLREGGIDPKQLDRNGSSPLLPSAHPLADGPEP